MSKEFGYGVLELIKQELKKGEEQGKNVKEGLFDVTVELASVMSTHLLTIKTLLAMDKERFILFVNIICDAVKKQCFKAAGLIK